MAHERCTRFQAAPPKLRRFAARSRVVLAGRDAHLVRAWCAETRFHAERAIQKLGGSAMPTTKPTPSTPLPLSGGSDWTTIHLMRVDQLTGEPTVLEDKLEFVKFYSIAWTHDHRGFFYHRYPAPGAKGDLGTEVGSNVFKEMW